MHVQLNAQDIACKSCANAITNSLVGMDGVQDVSVDVATKTVHVQYDENRVSLQQILQRLDEAGFPATILV